MTHDEKMRHWKEYDPIHYHEMMDDPTGVGDAGEGCGIYLVGLAIVIIWTIYMVLKYC